GRGGEGQGEDLLLDGGAVCETGGADPLHNRCGQVEAREGAPLRLGAVRAHSLSFDRRFPGVKRAPEREDLDGREHAVGIPPRWTTTPSRCASCSASWYGSARAGSAMPRGRRSWPSGRTTSATSAATTPSSAVPSPPRSRASSSPIPTASPPFAPLPPGP